MASPLITQAQIVDAILQILNDNNIAIEVFDDFPSDDDVVRNGIYVSDIHTVERIPYKLAVNIGGNLYIATDQLKIVYVSYQDDQYNTTVNSYISGLVSYIMDGETVQLMDGYHERDFGQELYYGVQSEKHTWTFQLKRLEIQ